KDYLVGVLDSRDRRRLALDQLDVHLDVHRTFYRGTHDLAFAHRVVTITEGQEGAGYVHTEIDSISCTHLGTVHVAAEIARNDRGANFTSGRCDADAAKERCKRYRPRILAIGRCGSSGSAFRIHVVSPRRLRKIRCQHRGLIVTNQCTKPWTEGRYSIRARRFEFHDVNRDS